MSEVTIAVVIIFIIVGFALVLALIVYRKRIFKKRPPDTVKRKAAFSLGGNFVEDLVVPIETKYEVTDTVLGSGSSAQVVIGENRKTRRKYAIKVIDLSRHEVAWRYEREKNFLRDIDHTNVVRLFEVYSSPKALYFVMELCTGGHLGQVLKASPGGKLAEEVALEYVLQLTRAIGHCHHHGICHRDVKLQNVLLESSSKEAQVKLVDFGNGARFRNNLPLTKVVGTTYTAAPEVFRECYDERCDVWSLGVVTYILLSGKRPFEKMEVPVTRDGQRRKEESVVASILLGKYNFDDEVWDEVSNEAINFIRHCFVLDYTKRSGAAMMLEHPWLLAEDEYLPLDKIRKLSFNSADTLRQTLGRELSSPFSGIRHISMLAVAFARPTEKVQMLRKVFQEIDYNGNGMIERDEFMSAMMLMNPDLSVADTNALFQRIDQDENHCISFIEFLAATLDPKDVDANELTQAFRLIDRDNKGYINRDDVYRILCTTNVQDLEYTAEQSKISAQGNSGSHNTFATAGASASVPAGAGAGHTGHSGAPASSPGGFLSSRRTTVAEGSGRSTHSAAEETDQRNIKLSQRIDEIMEQADLNRDGVISYDEFLYAMSGGDVTSFPVRIDEDIEGVDCSGPINLTDLTSAPHIMQKVVSEPTFVFNLKKKLSEGNVLFSGTKDSKMGMSFPVRQKPAHGTAQHTLWPSFRIPFIGSFYSRQNYIVSGGGGAEGAGSSGFGGAPAHNHSNSSGGANALSNMENGSPNGREVSIVSKFEEHDRQSVHSIHSVHSVHSRDLNNSRDFNSREHYNSRMENSREYYSREYHSRDRRLSEEPDGLSVRRYGSAHMSLSHSSKGPSWVDKPTPSTSFLLSGVLAGTASAGLLPSFVWNGRKPRGLVKLDIEAVIAKLEHTAQPADCHLRMNHDDPGLLDADRDKDRERQEQEKERDQAQALSPPASSVVVLEDVSECAGGFSSGGGGDVSGADTGGAVNSAYSKNASANTSALDVLDHVEDDLEAGIGALT